MPLMEIPPPVVPVASMVPPKLTPMLAEELVVLVPDIDPVIEMALSVVLEEVNVPEPLTGWTL